jgi:hypothetical protein
MQLFIISLLAVCHFQTTSPNRDVFNKFHTAYEKKDFVKISSLIDNEFKYVDEYRVMSKSKYMEFLTGWCQIFNTKWNVLSISEFNRLIISEERDSDLYNDFFSTETSKVLLTYTFKNGKIVELKAKSLNDLSTNKLIDEKFYKFLVWTENNYRSKVKHLNSYTRESAIEVKNLLEQYLTAIKLQSKT